MAIHHATLTKAAKIGIILSEIENDGFLAKWPKKNLELQGDNAALLLREMAALQDMTLNYRSFKLTIDAEDMRTVTVKGSPIVASDAYLYNAFDHAKAAWKERQSEKSVDDEGEEEEIEEEIELPSSVVSPTYRARYAEAGHPTHCGDWLAQTLVEATTNSGGINMELFETICQLNGVDTSKYNHTTHGWQGRVRMTGRNILARVVFVNDGVLKMPSDTTLQAPQEWMAAQHYKSSKPSAK